MLGEENATREHLVRVTSRNTQEGWGGRLNPLLSSLVASGRLTIRCYSLIRPHSFSLLHTHTRSFQKIVVNWVIQWKKNPTTLKTLWCLHFGVCPAQIIRFCKSVTIVLYGTLFVRNGVHSAWVPDWNRRGKRHAWRGPRFMLFMPCHRLSEPVTIHRLSHEFIGE